MRLAALLTTTAAALVVAGPAFAGDIVPVVNASTELANDFRGLVWAHDGKLYTSGHAGTVNEETRTIVARWNADGTLDPAFSEDGVVDLDLAPGRQESSLAVAELANGDVVVAVNAIDEDKGQSIYLLKFDSTGKQKVAPEWGDAEGKFEVVLGWANANNEAFPDVEKPPADTAWDLKVDTTGGKETLILVALGSAPEGTGRTDADRYILRLNPADGSLDPSFNGGKAFTYHSTGTFGDNARRVVIEADGSILAAGYTNLGEGLANHAVLIRLNPDGTPDQKFGNFIYPASSGEAVGLTPQPGVAVFNPFVADGGFAEVYAVAKLADGSYVTAGYGAATAEGKASTLGYQTTLAPDLVSFHVTASGLDMAFGEHGNGTFAVQSEGKGQPTAEERGRMAVGLPDGRAVLVGRYGGNAAIYVLTPEGHLDSAVDNDGILVLGHPTVGSQFFNAALSADGKRIALTTNADPSGARLVILEVQ